MEFKGYIAQKITEAMEIVFGQTVEGVESFIETPPNPEMGDFAFPCFKLSRTLRMGPPVIAGKLKDAIAADDTEGMKAKMKDLEETAMKLGEAVYAAQQQAQQQGAGAPPPPAGNANGGAKNDDGVVDAEVVD